MSPRLVGVVGAFLSTMTAPGRYGDDRTYTLPATWTPVTDEVLETALGQTLLAVTGDRAFEDLARYYDRAGSYSGTLFLDVEPNDPDNVEAADLYAVTTLSITLDARHGRLLLDEGGPRADVRRQLRQVNATLPITDLEHGDGGAAQTLQRMYELHARFRDLLDGASSRWVTAAKLCARKRPLLFPVRDNLVCIYLGGNRPMKSGDGHPGDFSVDIQVYAYLMTHAAVRNALSHLRAELTSDGVRVDEDLRLLDSTLWMMASRNARS
jgi:hypothetical protein